MTLGVTLTTEVLVSVRASILSAVILTAESTTDDNTDCQVDHVAAHGKCLKFFQKLFHIVLSNRNITNGIRKWV